MGALRRYSWIAGFPVLAAGFSILVLLPGRRSWATGAILLGGVMLLAGVILNFRDLAAIARGRSVRYGANAVFYSLLVLGILAAVNFLASRHRARVDLTQGAVHTLAPQTVKVLRGLDKDVEVIGFFTDQMGGERQKFQDLTEEYEYESNHFKARTVDPRRSPGEAEMHKIVQDGTVVVQAPSGDTRITSVSEQSLTNAIVKATRGSHPEVCFTTGHGEASRSDDGPEGFHMVTTALEGEGYKSRDVLLIRQPEVPEDCNVLVTAGPSTPLIPSEVAEISRYLKTGGRLLVLKRNPADRIGLDGLLADYGLKVNSDTIVDRLSKAMGGDEFSPVVVSYEPHPVTKPLEDNGIATFFPVASSVDAMKATEKGVTSEIVARTSDAAWGETGKVARFDKKEDHPGPVGIVAVASGPAVAPEPVEPASKTSDSGGPASVPPGAESAPEGAAPAAKTEKASLGGEESGAAESAPSKERRVVLIGDADFASNAYLNMSGNSDLFLNAVGWLAQAGDLISIRPKDNVPQPVTLTAARANVLSAMTYLAPLVALIGAVLVWTQRKSL